MIAYSVELLLNCKKMRPSLNPGIVNRTQLHPIRGLSSIEIGNRTKSYSEKKKYWQSNPIERSVSELLIGVRVAETNNKFLMYFCGEKYNKCNV